MRLLPNETLLKSHRRGVYLTQLSNDDGEPPVFLVYDCDHDEYGTEPADYDDLADAQARYDIEVKVACSEPDWEAQARYDEEHGTVNGYDERIEDAIAIHNYEAGDY